MRKIFALLAVLAVAAGLTTYSLGGLHAPASSDYFASKGALSRLEDRDGKTVRVPVSAGKSDLAYLPLSPVDGVYFQSASTGAVTVTEQAHGPERVTVKGGTPAIFSLNSPFSSYEIVDWLGEISIKPLQNGSFAVVDGTNEEGRRLKRVYSMGAILKVTFLEKSQPVTSFDLFPGLLLEYFPDDASALRGVDSLRIRQMEKVEYYDVADPAWSARVFGDKERPLFQAFSDDLGAQVAAYRDMFDRRKELVSADADDLPDPLSPNPWVLSEAKRAAALEVLLAKRLNEVAERTGDFDKSYITDVMDRLEKVGPLYRARSEEAVRKFYSLYFFSQIFAGNSDVILGRDTFTKAIRDLFGCDMPPAYFAGISNVFMSRLYKSVSPVLDDKQSSRRAFETVLRAYLLDRISIMKEAEKPAAGTKSSSAASCANQDSDAIRASNAQAFWFFLSQYFSRKDKDDVPTIETVRLMSVLLQLGDLYLDSANGDGALSSRLVRTMAITYRDLTSNFLASVRKGWLVPDVEPPAFRPEFLQGEDLTVDKEFISEWGLLVQGMSGVRDRFLSVSTEGQDRPLRSMVEAVFLQQTIEPTRYLHCLFSREREYRFALDKASFCQGEVSAYGEGPSDAPQFGSAVAGGVRASVSDGSGISVPAPVQIPAPAPEASGTAVPEAAALPGTAPAPSGTSLSGTSAEPAASAPALSGAAEEPFTIPPILKPRRGRAPVTP